ncbi:MAG TPA: hypothetical protein VE225_03940 [Rubrobacteraceae bacterium]|nr:hypothetical protein [Rubrobacteraceae bacterium]
MREQGLNDTAKRPGEEARKEKTDGEGESVDLSKGEAPAEPETYGTYDERVQTPPPRRAAICLTFSGCVRTQRYAR